MKDVPKLPPKQIKRILNKSKTSKQGRRPNVLTLGDENTDTNSRCDSSDHSRKLLSTYGPKQRKKVTSSRKKL